MTLKPLLGVSDPLVPDLILGPRKPLDFGELQQPVRRDTTRFFGTMSKVPMDWAAPAIKPEPLEPQPDEYGPATAPNCAVAGRPRNFTPWATQPPNELFLSDDVRIFTRACDMYGTCWLKMTQGAGLAVSDWKTEFSLRER